MSFSKELDKEGDTDTLPISQCAASDAENAVGTDAPQAELQVEVEVEEEELDLCGYCGFEEKFLGNQFVKVRTL